MICFFSADEYKVTTTTDGDVVTRTAPGCGLLIQVFKTKIIDGAAAGKLSSNEVFKEYFRELVFQGRKIR
jgi:uncharacterized protein YbcV (DUF1398 family)